MTPIELAKECGAKDRFYHMEFDGPALDAFVRRISGKAYERAARACKKFATCDCNGKFGRCNENDLPLACAAAIRSLKEKK